MSAYLPEFMQKLHAQRAAEAANLSRRGFIKLTGLAGGGLVLAVAILFDALVVKMTLIPAFFTWLGEKTWYIPRWLDRLLPDITIESPHEGDSDVAPDVDRPVEAV